MVPTPPDEPNARTDARTQNPIRRRRILALGAGVGAALLAGCSSDSTPGDGADSTPTTTATDAGGAVGSFRLLISDQPVAIDDFDSLTVSFDRARIFRAQAAEDGEGAATGTRTGATADENPDGTPTANDTASATPTETPDPDDSDGEDGEPEEEADPEQEPAEQDENEREPEEEDDADSEGEAGFSVIDLGGASVDLTEVIGERAIRVFDGDLTEGRYAKIELHAADVAGVVDGEAVGVTIPSGKLQIVHPFEVRAGETVEFVFDINVVEKGNTGEYNLLPVISESGVAGEDIAVEEIGSAGPNAGEDEDTDDDDEAPADDEPDDEDEDGDEDAGGQDEADTPAAEEDEPDDGPPDETAADA